MVARYVDVIRSYLIFVFLYPETLRVEKPGYRSPKLRCVCKRWEADSVELAIRAATLLEVIGIVPGLLRLLKPFLAPWLAIFPFVLAGLSGWFTISWMALIRHELSSMYKLLKKLKIHSAQISMTFCIKRQTQSLLI